MNNLVLNSPFKKNIVQHKKKNSKWSFFLKKIVILVHINNINSSHFIFLIFIHAILFFFFIFYIISIFLQPNKIEQNLNTFKVESSSINWNISEVYESFSIKFAVQKKKHCLTPKKTQMVNWQLSQGSFFFQKLLFFYI